MKKAVIFLVVIIMCCSLITLCGCDLLDNLTGNKTNDSDGTESDTSSKGESKMVEISWTEAKKLLEGYQTDIENGISFANDISIRATQALTFEYSYDCDVEVVYELINDKFVSLWYEEDDENTYSYAIYALCVYEDETTYCGGTGDYGTKLPKGEDILVTASSYNYENSYYYAEKDLVASFVPGYYFLNPLDKIENGSGIEGFKKVKEKACFYDKNKKELKVTVSYDTSLFIGEKYGKYLVAREASEDTVLTDCITEETYKYKNGLMTSYERTITRKSDKASIIPGSSLGDALTGLSSIKIEWDSNRETICEGLPFDVEIKLTEKPLQDDAYFTPDDVGGEAEDDAFAGPAEEYEEVE